MDFILGPIVTQKGSSDFIATCIPLKNEGLCKVLVRKKDAKPNVFLAVQPAGLLVSMNSLLSPTKMNRNTSLVKVLSKISVKIGEPEGAVMLPNFLWSPSSNGRNTLVLQLFPLRRWRRWCIQGIVLSWTFNVLCTVCFPKHPLERTSIVHGASQEWVWDIHVDVTDARPKGNRLSSFSKYSK